MIIEACVKPAGHVDNDGDCYDANADAKPGSTISHQEDHRGDGSHDYDCDGEETRKWVELGTCPDVNTDPVTPGTVGWWDGIIPDCGIVGSWKSNAAACPGGTPNLVQRCR